MGKIIKSAPSQMMRIVQQYGKKALEEFLSKDENFRLLSDWNFIARQEQLPPEGDWLVWFLRGGRGLGKTHSGVMFCYSKVLSGCKDGMIIGATASDLRDYMIEGPSGFLNVSTIPKEDRPIYESSKSRLVFPKYGAKIITRSAEKPDRLRGRQGEFCWCDEFASWHDPRYAWEMLFLGQRMGNPQTFITTTPRNLSIIKEILDDKYTVQTYGTTYDNKANLSSRFIEQIKTKYEGSRLGRQEIMAEILDDNPDAMFSREKIDKNRVGVDDAPQMSTIVVALDPSGTSDEKSDECGIIVCGMAKIGNLEHFYILEDASCKKPPDVWAKTVCAKYKKHKANRVVAETNYGGDMVKAVLKHVNPNVIVKKEHATRGKALRAEPIAILYEQGRVHHVGSFLALEDEMCQWDPTDLNYSPNRLDALVWGVTNLSRKSSGTIYAR
jgi:phage terminase large subunit-like protein